MKAWILIATTTTVLSMQAIAEKNSRASDHSSGSGVFTTIPKKRPDSPSPVAKAEADLPEPGEFVLDYGKTRSSRVDYGSPETHPPYNMGLVDGLPAVRLFQTKLDDYSDFYERTEFKSTLSRDLVVLGPAKTQEEAIATCEKLAPKGEWTLPSQNLLNELLEHAIVRGMFLPSINSRSGEKVTYRNPLYGASREWRDREHNQIVAWSVDGQRAVPNSDGLLVYQRGLHTDSGEKVSKLVPTSLKGLQYFMSEKENKILKTEHELLVEHINYLSNDYEAAVSLIKFRERALEKEKKRYFNHEYIQKAEEALAQAKASAQVIKVQIEQARNKAPSQMAGINFIIQDQKRARQALDEFYKNGIPVICQRMND